MTKSNTTKMTPLMRQSRNTTRDSLLLQPVKIPTGKVRYRQARIPRNFLNRADTLTMHVSGSIELGNLSAGAAPHLVALKPASIASTDYWGLGNFTPIVASLAANYSRFMVTNLRIGIQGTTAVTGGGFVIANYEPTDSSLANPTNSVADISNSTHVITVSPGDGMRYLSVDPLQYFNDWKQCTGETDEEGSDRECGVVQVLGRNAAAVNAMVILISLSYDIHFAGYRV